MSFVIRGININEGVRSGTGGCVLIRSRLWQRRDGTDARLAAGAQASERNTNAAPQFGSSSVTHAHKVTLDGKSG